jgi:hypothetical protein
MSVANNVLQFDPIEIKADLPDVKTKIDLEKFMLGMVPFTPVQFKGPDAYLAWVRLAGYGLLAYATYNKMRPLSYIALGAAGVSLATSLTAKMWAKKP